MKSGHGTLTYGGFSIHYALYGKGNPLLCLHGLNLDGRMFAGKNMKELFPDRMIVALDLPGYGRSDFIPGAGVLEISKLIDQLADKLDLNQFELCGFCLGGIFALDYAIRNPGRLSKLYLIETMIYLPWWMTLCNTSVFRILYRGFSRNRLCLALLEMVPALKGLRKMQSLKLTSRLWNNRVNSFYINMMKGYQKIDHLQRSKAVSCETMLIFSDQSFKMIRKTNYGLQAALRHSTLYRLPNDGHFSPVSGLTFPICRGGREEQSILKNSR